ncbi:MAG TPA: hypothetical protein DCE41_33705 [Cytophagales bacterium]|nr:hypothetical protein [Cytophagales bacterium]HAA18676.1 hypothetical protein [Cytophagales bacterium]HAP60088.1 hypothetical protein [Cytophagales bacterium]
MKCLNCQYEHEEKFCPNCGQKADIPKITFESVILSGITTLTSMDQGFFFNFRELFLRPKALVKDYLNGRRKSILNPVSYLILCTTVYLIIVRLVDAGPPPVMEYYEENREKMPGLTEGSYSTGKFIGENLKYFWILSIFWLSFSTKLIFKKLNLAEHMALNAFTLGQATLITSVSEFFMTWPIFFNPLPFLFLMVLTYKIFQTKKWDIEAMVQSFLSILLFIIQFLLIMVLLFFVIN